MAGPVVSLCVAFLVALVAACAGAQPLTAGTLTGRPASNFGPLVTVIDGSSPGLKPGILRTATFVWSNAPCPMTAKIKFFQLVVGLPPSRGYMLRLLAERGPFDVHRAIETVTLDPPVSTSEGTFIGISSVTLCGGPVKAAVGPAAVMSGDYEGNVVMPVNPFEAMGISALVRAYELSTPSPLRQPRFTQFRN